MKKATIWAEIENVITNMNVTFITDPGVEQHVLEMYFKELLIRERQHIWVAYYSTTKNGSCGKWWKWRRHGWREPKGRWGSNRHIYNTCTIGTWLETLDSTLRILNKRMFGTGADPEGVMDRANQSYRYGRWTGVCTNRDNSVGWIYRTTWCVEREIEREERERERKREREGG